MPAYPFILLGVVFVAVVFVPPLVAAFIDDRRRSLMAGDDTPGDEGPPPGTTGRPIGEDVEESEPRRDRRRG